MWNPSEAEVSHTQQMYHHPSKDPSSHVYPAHWYGRYPPAGVEQTDPSLIDYSTELPQEMHNHSRDGERPFKAYSRTPTALPGSFYGSQSAFPTSIPIPNSSQERGDFSNATPSCNSSLSLMPRIPQPTPLAHNSHSLHSSLTTTESSSRTATESHRQSSTPSSSIAMNGSPDDLSRPKNAMSSNPDSGSCSDNSTSPLGNANSPQDGDSAPGRSEFSGFRVPPKKRPHTVPEDAKDSCYWEKRKKNNESAKRSREARRMKEEQIAMRVVYLEQENLQLRTELSLLKTEIEKLRCMLYNP